MRKISVSNDFLIAIIKSCSLFEHRVQRAGNSQLCRGNCNDIYRFLMWSYLLQCFCFEEQILNPDEEVDMPVFFYIDPEYAVDPHLENTDTIDLSYTFFEAKDGMSLPVPGYAIKAH